MMLSSSSTDFDATALISGDEILRYSDLFDLAERLVGEVAPRSLVFIKASNSIACVSFYIGCLRKGIVALLVSADIELSLWDALVATYNPEFVWVPVPDGADCADGPADKDIVLSEAGYALVRLAASSPQLHDDLALLLSTSGSTGSPKLVRLSYGNLRSNAEAIAEYLGIGAKDRAITTLPFAYSYGISVVNSHLISGASLILTNASLMSRDFWNALKEHEATSFAGVPYTYQMLERLRFARMDLPSIRYITQAGGRLGERLHEYFARTCAEKGIDFYVMYGQTEATARMSYLPAHLALEKIGSIGYAIPGGSFQLEDADGMPVETVETEGQLVYRGPNVSMGYAISVADLAKGDERGGVLHTGDLARCDESGCYYITGRLGRFLKVYGNRVGLDELESLLAGKGIVAAAFGVDDQVKLLVDQGEPAEAMRIAAELTGLNQSAFAARKATALPRNSAGKLLYSEMETIWDQS